MFPVNSLSVISFLWAAEPFEKLLYGESLDWESIQAAMVDPLELLSYAVRRSQEWFMPRQARLDAAGTLHHQIVRHV
jgi:hypothetical protein